MKPRNLSDGEQYFCLVHIPKTAGSSLRVTIESRFSQEEIYKFYDGNPKAEFDTAALTKYRFFSGHYDYNKFLSILPKNTCFVTILRNPFERIISHYYFWRSYKLDFAKTIMANTEGPELARSLSLHDFLRCKRPIVRGTIYNVQARQIGGCLGMPLYKIDMDDLIARAERNLQEFDFIGTSDRYDQAIELLHHTFDWSPPRKTVSVNTFEELSKHTHAFDKIVRDQPITDEVRSLLLANTEADRQIYDLACGIFEQRYRDFAMTREAREKKTPTDPEQRPVDIGPAAR